MQPRRSFLATVGTAAAVSLAGCWGNPADVDTPETDPDSTAGAPPPLSDRELPLGHSLSEFRDAVLNAGVEQDGIPSIDDPSFTDTGDVDYDEGHPVFGVARNGTVKAYPQSILVHHEIVNDVHGDQPVAVTYCPLTGTVQGFERGSTEFGVSGNLLNDNLVMYDRETESWWPQILATSVAGDHAGNVLREFEVTWTTWSRWTEAHPDTLVLSEDTGYLRDYGDDPYGSYNPASGYYDNANVFYEPMKMDGRLPPKAVVVGARTSDGAIAVEKERVRAEGLVETSIGGTLYAFVHEPTLDTAVVYRNAEERDLGRDGDQPTVDGVTYDPEELPLERVVSFDSMWFPWAAYYPKTGLVEA